MGCAYQPNNTAKTKTQLQDSMETNHIQAQNDKRQAQFTKYRMGCARTRNNILPNLTDTKD
jgi:hypothetical protein